jgi:hypothetical protein
MRVSQCENGARKTAICAELGLGAEIPLPQLRLQQDAEASVPHRQQERFVV